jgi:REP element-mobilizing transposase RayT
MRHARLTWEGAFHHIMNRGVNEEKIFSSADLKSKYIELLAEKSVIYRMRILAYCIMDNHYHLLLQNSSGKLSEFMRNLNSQYGFYYRRVIGGKGYVFQDRFKSTLIQNESYLVQAIVYVIQNPVRANLVDRFDNYSWSSGSLYFSGDNKSFIDRGFVEDLFGSKENFFMALQSAHKQKYVVKRSKYGQIFGDEEFIKEAEKKYDRRKERSVRENKRTDDRYFEPVEKIIFEFQQKYGIKLEDI